MLYSIETEQNILATLMTVANSMENITLEQQDFFSGRHQTVFSVIQELHHKQQPYDSLFVLDILKQRNWLEQAGGEEYLLQIMRECSSIATALQPQTKKLKKLRECRDLEQVGEKIKELAQQTMTDNLQEQALDLLMGLNPQNEEMGQMIADSMLDVFDLMNTRSQRKDIGISTGLKHLDNLIGEIEPSHLCVIAGSPGGGKSTLAQKIALNACLYRHKPTLFFSLEMKTTDIASRMLSAVAKIPFERIRTGQLQGDDAQKWAIAHDRYFKNAPLKIVDKAGLTITQIRAECRKMLAQYGNMGCIVIDYLQLMTDPRQKTRFDEISQISRDLKKLAKDFNTPVIALSQMNRQGQKTKPNMGALRESGQIEQDADQIIFVWRESIVNPDIEDDGTAEMIVAKNRHGKTGSCRVATVFEYCMFSDLQVVDRA